MTSTWAPSARPVAFVGLSCRDHVWRVDRFPPTASRTQASAYRADGGGPAATAAAAAARLGACARLWAIHGDDEDGRALVADLARAGVDLRGCRTPEGSRSFVSAVLVDPSGERYIFPYRGAALADEPAAHDWSGLEGVGAVLVDGRHAALATYAVGWAARHGVPSVGDWGDLRWPDLRARIDHLVAAEEAGVGALRATGHARAGTDDPIDRAVRAAAALRDRPDQLVAVTLGPRGCVWDDGEDVWWQAAPEVTAVETNGAGDAFHGAYAAAIAADWSTSEAVRLATAVGALKCTGEGRAALPDLPTATTMAAALPAPVPLGRSSARSGGPA